MSQFHPTPSAGPGSIGGLGGKRALGRGLVTLLAIALLSPVLAGCQMVTPQADAQGFTSTAQVTRGTMSSVVQMAGQVVAEEERQLMFGTVSGRVKEIPVQVGQEVEEGQILVQLDTTALERQLREVEADKKVAETALAAAQQTSGEAEIAEAEAELAQANYDLAAAKQALDAAVAAGLTPLQEAVDDAQARLQAAQDDLQLKQTTLNQATLRQLEYQQAFFQRKMRDAQAGSADYQDAQAALVDVERQISQTQADRDKALTAARETITTLEAEVKQDQDRLARVEAGDEDPLAALRLDYEQAAAAQEQAQQTLDDLRQGVDSDAVQAAKTNLEAATARVEDAQAAIDATTLRAPFAGVVYSINAGVGSIVQGSDSVIYLVNAKSLQIQAQASESDITKLEVGQVVRTSFDAKRGTFYEAKIVELPIRGQEMSGMSTYTVVAALLNPDSDIRPGMLANMRVLVGERENVLMVPAAAVQYNGPYNIYVTVMGADGQSSQQQIQIGMNDGIMVEVLSGLNEGDTVVMPLVAPGSQSGMPGGVIVK